jgi:hypothetical protein
MPSSRLSPEERILGAVKHLDLTLSEIKEQMDLTGGSLDERVNVRGSRGILRFVIRCRHTSQTSWSMSLILNSARFDGRIDCIDWEPLFVDIDGKSNRGFHRHIWNAKAMSCDRSKLPLPHFRPSDAEDFIVLGARMLRVTIREELA